MTEKLEILYADDHYVAINKPHDLLVHRSKIACDVEVFALQMLRDQLGQHVHPAHRLDRKTSGVLLFALNLDSLREIRKIFEAEEISKKYWAIVRGYSANKETIDYPLKSERGNMQNALTSYRTLEKTEVMVPFGKHNTSRYSLIEVIPKTGRMHQIRKHIAHIFHPIIGDRPHGCNKQNKLFKERWGINQMFLHAVELSFIHPILKKSIHITANPHTPFSKISHLLKFNHSLKP